MKKIKWRLLLLPVVCICLLAAVGCDKDSTPDADSEVTAAETAETTTETAVETTAEATETETEKEPGTESESETEPPHVHEFGDWVIVTESTCTETGARERSCACGETERETLEALGHDEVNHDAKEPTCTEAGWDAYVACSRCDYTTYVRKVALGHSFVDDKCEHCGLKTSKGLQYKLNSDGDSYSVTDIDSCTDTNIVIPSVYEGKPVTGIGDYAFSYCERLTSISLPDSVTSIGNYAFSYCERLTSITIPDSVTSIGDMAFGFCFDLTNITIPDSVTSIGSEAFSVCANLISITIGNGVTSIGDIAFTGCRNLTSITIGNGVTSIGAAAFFGCESLTSITIPDSVTFIGDGVFTNCTGLTSIMVAEGNTVYHADGNCLIETASKTLIAGCMNSVIPTDGSVTSIGKEAFSECFSLKSIIIPNGVTSIGDDAFYWCHDLTNITIPDSVTSIGSSAFSGCESLTSSITIPNSVTIIGDQVFWECKSLTSITIPDSVTSIGEEAFYKCENLESINFTGTKEQWYLIDKDIFWKFGTGSFTVHCTDGDIAYEDA